MTKEKEEKSEVYKFSSCVVDADRRELMRAGDAVTMQPKAFELLLYLLRNRHRAVDKDELQDELWPRSIVTETALTRCVMKARRAVGDDADKQAIIKTVHGHGYRFTASIEDATKEGPAATEAPVVKTRRRRNLQGIRVVAASAVLLTVIVGAWLYFTPPALSGPVRLAVLPIENATGDSQLDWVTSGLLALMNRMLQDGGIDIVSSREVTALAGNESLSELIATGSEFREKLARTTAATHVLAARLEDNNGLYRLTYTLADANRRPTRRTMVGTEPAILVRDVVDTVTAQIVEEPPPSDAQSSVSKDAFLNEAYARAMALYHEGRYEDAKSLFEVIIEQEPQLFWPRYERALALRNLRDFESAERELLALREETASQGREKEHASVENALGIIYMGKRRNDEARVAFDKVVEISLRIDNKLRAATGYENLGLLEKNQGNSQQAYAYMQMAEQVYTDTDIAMLPGTLLNNMAGILMQMGQFEDAEQHSIRAVETFRYTGKRLYESYALSRLSDIYTNLRVYDDALEMAERSLSVRRELNDPHGIGASLINISDIASQRGNITQSLQTAKEAYDIGIDNDDEGIAVAAKVRIARAELRLGNPETAIAHWAEIETIASTGGDRRNVFGARLGMAQAQIEMGRYDDAMGIATQLLGQVRAENQRRQETAALRLVAAVYSARQDQQQAIRPLLDAYAIAAEIEDSVVMASLHILLAEAYLESGDAAAAAEHVAAAASARPEDYDSLKVQAKYASLTGEAEQASKLMGLARSSAGEGWSDEDDQLLAQYRSTVADP